MSEDRRETGGLRLFIKAALLVGADALYRPTFIDLSSRQNRRRRGDHWSPVLRLPFFSCLFLRKRKRIAAPGEEKQRELPETAERSPCRQSCKHAHSPSFALHRPWCSLSAGNSRAARYLDDGGQIAFYEYVRSGDALDRFLKKSEYSVNCLLFRADCARMG